MNREIRLRQVLEDATRLLDDLHAPWVIAGAFAADEHRAEHRTTTDADLIVAGTPYQHLAIARGRHGVLTVEDVLVHKVLAWRPKDRADIASILSTGIRFDNEYVDHWAAEWEVTDRCLEAQSWA